MTSVIAKPESLEIDFQRAAIVVVDMQNAFAKDGGMLSLCGLDISAAETVIKINEELLAAARSAGDNCLPRDELSPRSNRCWR